MLDLTALRDALVRFKLLKAERLEARLEVVRLKTAKLDDYRATLAARVCESRLAVAAQVVADRLLALTDDDVGLFFAVIERGLAERNGTHAEERAILAQFVDEDEDEP